MPAHGLLSTLMGWRSCTTRKSRQFSISSFPCEPSVFVDVHLMPGSTMIVVLRNAVSDSLNVMSVAFDALIHRTPRPSMPPPLDPSAAPPSVFRLARTKSGWRAGAPTCADKNSAGGNAKLFRRRNSAPVRKCAHKDPNKVNNF